MNTLGITDSKNKALVNYTISLFTDKNYEVIGFKSTELLQKIEASKFLIISFSHDTMNDAFEQWFSRIEDKTVFNKTSILVLTTSSQAVLKTDDLQMIKNQLLPFGATVLDEFNLPNADTNFSLNSGITDVKLSLELIRKTNRIKQHKLKAYFHKKQSSCGIDTTGFENCDSGSY